MMRIVAILLVCRPDETWNGEGIEPSFFSVGTIEVWLE
jgi:hypothetical protein